MVKIVDYIDSLKTSFAGFVKGIKIKSVGFIKILYQQTYSS